MTKLKEASVLFFIQVLSYTIWCINFRAVADAQYHTAALSDFMIASIQFFVIRRIAHGQDHLHQWAGVHVGGDGAGEHHVVTGDAVSLKSALRVEGRLGRQGLATCVVGACAIGLDVKRDQLHGVVLLLR